MSSSYINLPTLLLPCGIPNKTLLKKNERQIRLLNQLISSVADRFPSLIALKENTTASFNYAAASIWRVTRVVEYFPTSSIKAPL